jgi:putative tryptophan/tyrosine transport system substrate-binding protein
MRFARLAVLASLAVVFFGAPRAAEAQPAKLPRIGYLAGSQSGDGAPQPFLEGLRELGWFAGQNIAIEYRWSEGKAERLPDLVAELIRLKVDVIYTPGSNAAAQAAQRATTTIPIVFTTPTDSVALGLAASLSRPGGNITGIGGAIRPSKRLELLREVVPKASRVAILWTRGNPSHPRVLRETETAARALGLQPQPLEVGDPAKFESAFAAMTRARADACVVLNDVMFLRERARIVALAAASRTPAIYGWQQAVEDGGLASYGEDRSGVPRRAAEYVDKILRGAKPGDLPIEQPTRFVLAINLKTARALGLTIPPAVLARADEVIQ